jgi:hypothetical protein
MPDTNLRVTDSTVQATAWHTKSGVRLELTVDMLLSDKELAEFVRLSKVNALLLLKLAVLAK